MQPPLPARPQGQEVKQDAPLSLASLTSVSTCSHRAIPPTPFSESRESEAASLPCLPLPYRHDTVAPSWSVLTMALGCSAASSPCPGRFSELTAVVPTPHTYSSPNKCSQEAKGMSGPSWHQTGGARQGLILGLL